MSTGTEAGRRRRVRLTPVRPIPVEFAGERAGEGPLTLGQLDVYTWTSSTPDHPHGVLRAELPVPAVASVGDVAGAVAALIARHETLRTTFVPGERPRQRVAGVRRPAAGGVLAGARGSGGRRTGRRWPGRWSGGCGSHPIRAAPGAGGGGRRSGAATG